MINYGSDLTSFPELFSSLPELSARTNRPSLLEVPPRDWSRDYATLRSQTHLHRLPTEKCGAVAPTRKLSAPTGHAISVKSPCTATLENSIVWSCGNVKWTTSLKRR